MPLCTDPGPRAGGAAETQVPLSLQTGESMGRAGVNPANSQGQLLGAPGLPRTGWTGAGLSSQATKLTQATGRRESTRPANNQGQKLRTQVKAQVVGAEFGAGPTPAPPRSPFQPPARFHPHTTDVFSTLFHLLTSMNGHPAWTGGSTSLRMHVASCGKIFAL